MQNVKLLQAHDLQVLQARHLWREGEGEGHYRWVFVHCTLALGVYGPMNPYVTLWLKKRFLHIVLKFSSGETHLPNQDIWSSPNLIFLWNEDTPLIWTHFRGQRVAILEVVAKQPETNDDMYNFIIQTSTEAAVVLSRM